MTDKYNPRDSEDEKGFDPEDNNNESDFNTEKFYVNDERYKKDKLNSYSHYSDYNKEEDKQCKYDNYAEDGSDPAEDFFDKDKKVYSNTMDSKDVEKMVDKKIKKNKTPCWKFLLAALIGALLGAAIVYVAGNMIVESPSQTETGQVESLNISPTDEVNVEVAVNEKCKDSVVGITTVVMAQNHFFPIQSYAEGVGSGVIVSEDGYILTNSHVVSDGKAEHINVILSNQENYDGELVWFEPEMDLAVVKIEADGLQPVELGDSDELLVGEKAIAIGNPLGMDLQSTLTSGYISGLDRSITMETGLSMDGLIQTDAAINSGNSGGALLNAQGQLIGINTAKASADNIGFAIPINTAKVVIERIQTSDSFEPVTLGVSAINLDYYEGITGNETEAENGIIVMEVMPGSSADDAGIQQGDIITHVDGVEIGSMGQLRTQLLAYYPADTAEFEIVRDNLSETVTVKFSGDLI